MEKLSLLFLPILVMLSLTGCENKAVKKTNEMKEFEKNITNLGNSIISSEKHINENLKIINENLKNKEWKMILFFIVPLIISGAIVIYFSPIVSISILAIILLIMNSWGKSLGSAALGQIPIYLGLFLGAVLGAFTNLIIKAYF